MVWKHLPRWESRRSRRNKRPVPAARTASARVEPRAARAGLLTGLRRRLRASPSNQTLSPTFLLLEGLDGARVVHHCDVQRASSRIACVRKPKCGACGEDLRCVSVGVLSAPILPDGLTADAQSQATPVSAPQAPPTRLPVLPVLHGCCHGDG